MQNNLLDRVKKCKNQTGVSYKSMYSKCGISTSVFYNFTSGVRDLPQRYVEALDNFLKNLGY